MARLPFGDRIAERYPLRGAKQATLSPDTASHRSHFHIFGMDFLALAELGAGAFPRHRLTGLCHGFNLLIGQPDSAARLKGCHLAQLRSSRLTVLTPLTPLSGGNKKGPETH